MVNNNLIENEYELSDDFYILEMEIKGGTQKSAKMKATLQLLYSWSGIFHDWKIKFHNVIIDKLTTASWIKNNDTKYKIREELFNFINIGKQSARNNTNDNLLYKLSLEELELMSDFFNDKKTYNSTIYNIITFLKGSNPSGAYQNVAASQIWECSTKHEYNIHIFLKKFIITKSQYARGKEKNKLAWDKANQSNWIENIEGYLNEPDRKRMKDIFLKFQVNNSEKHLLRIAKSTAENLAQNFIKHFEEIEKISNIKRSEYANNIEKEFGSLQKAFEMCWNTKRNEHHSIDRAHIFPVKIIKKQLINCWENKEARNILISKISDPYNFLPLDKICHYNGYDSFPCKLYWNSFGKLIKIDELFYEHHKDLFKHYKRIYPNYLVKCKKYLEEYNDYYNKNNQ